MPLSPTLPAALLDALDLGSMTPDEQQSLLDQVGEIVTASALLRFMDALPEQDREMLSALLADSESDDAVNAFIAEHAAAADAATTAALAELTDDILAITGPGPA